MRETSWVAFFLCDFDKRGERFGYFCHRWGEGQMSSKGGTYGTVDK